MTSVRRRLGSSPRRLLVLSAAMAALAVAAPVSGARAAFLPIGVPGGVAQGGQANAPSGCVGSNAPSGVGDAGATSNQICGAVLAFVGPSIGQVATTIGPTIIGATVLAPITVSAGPVAVSSLP
ncbi:MAG: hypothetical protein JWO02_4127 [Solirubrobacterales bacterium]|nr:hypothetical protein [Solirubrobacterales bacterium]